MSETALDEIGCLVEIGRSGPCGTCGLWPDSPPDQDDRDRCPKLKLRAENSRLSAEVAELKRVLEEVSPMCVCSRCGKEFRSHEMVWEEGDERECVPCNDRCNAQERANARGRAKAVATLISIEQEQDFADVRAEALSVEDSGNG